jgi:putative ABC transport system permease protein
MGINREAGKVLLVVIGFSTLLLALKSQWASMIERRRDIAILKTIGWSPSVILALLVLESLIQAFAGSLLGCIAGQILLVAGSAFGPGAPLALNHISPVTWEAAVGLALMGGLIAGIIPALYAARQWPAAGLRVA